MRDYKILKSTGWSKGKEGQEKPCRLVVVAWLNPDGSVYEYSRHWEANDGAMFWGHYYHPREGYGMEEALERAMYDFEKTLMEHNATYGVNNISHLPKQRKNAKKPQKTTKKKRCK